MKERASKNFDHPEAVDIKLLIKNIKTLIKGESIKQPLYNFSKHIRRQKWEVINPCPIVIVEGILIFHFKDLVDLFSLKIFLDIAPDIRFIRRLKRDIKGRNRKVNDICKKNLKFVRPMHNMFVEKTKYDSDIVLKNDYDYNFVLDSIKNISMKTDEPKIK